MGADLARHRRRSSRVALQEQAVGDEPTVVRADVDERTAALAVEYRTIDQEVLPVLAVVAGHSEKVCPGGREH